MAPRSLSIDMAAAALSCSRRTIYYLIKEGQLQTIRTLGGSLRVLESSLKTCRWVRPIQPYARRRPEKSGE